MEELRNEENKSIRLQTRDLCYWYEHNLSNVQRKVYSKFEQIGFGFGNNRVKKIYYNFEKP